MGAYKDTLVLPNTDMPIKASFEKEQSVYESWGDIYQKFKRDGKNPFILHDGPPYANGDIHIGHALNKILKDFAVKFHYFNGQAVEFVPGWDCHGLPIEQKVRKDKPDDLLKACREYAAQQVEIQKKQFKSLGIIADWENPYLTMDYQYEANTVQSLYELKDKGYLFQGLKPVYWSWAEQTALAEAEIEYAERTDKSVYVAFPARGGGLLIWTTTPWTLPANVAVAVHPDLLYRQVGVKNYFIPLYVAETLVPILQEKGIVTYVFDNLIQGKNLKLNVENPAGQQVPVVCADFVSDQTGTGCVHIAPAHGVDDYQVALQNNLPILSLVGPDGKYTEGPYQGINVFVANKQILEDLKIKNIKEEYVTHNYPHCWRSGKPVIFRATEQWFLNLEKLRENVLKEFEKVDFQPEVSKNRMKPMLEGRPDWCISRQRSWGVPILFSEKDILDVWYDSGFSWHILNGRQADLYLEGNDQHRGWFQSSLWLSTALQGKAPYKKVITHGFVVDGDGKKMSKSKGNVINPNDIVKKYGAEILRYWVATTDYTKDVTISDEILKRAVEGHRKLRNTLRYLTANTNTGAKEYRLLPIDYWMLRKTHFVFQEIHNSFENYLYFQGMQKLSEYINVDLSGIYMNSIKDRLYCDKIDLLERQGVVFTLNVILNGLLPLIAPLFTYTASEVLNYHSKEADIFELLYRPTYYPTRHLPFEPPELDEVYWKKALEEFHVHFDKLKQEGKVRDTLEISLEYNLPLFEGIADWFVVGNACNFTNREAMVEFGNFRIVKSELNKCERCWKRNAKDTLCERCAEFMTS